MNERISTRDLAELLTGQIGLDKKRAEDFLNALSSYILHSIESNKVVRIMGLGTFKVLLVRERESVHIQTGERFVIPAHHKLSFVPDRDLKEQINRPFAFFEPIESSEIHVPKKVTLKRDNDFLADKIVNEQNEVINPDNVVTESETIENNNIVIKDYFEFEEKDEVSEDSYSFEEEVDYEALNEIPKTTGDSEEDDFDESVYRELQEISLDSESTEEKDEDDLEKEEISVAEEDSDENDYVQTIAVDDEEYDEIGDDEKYKETEFSAEEVSAEDDVTESIEDKRVETEQVTTKTVAEKRIFAPLWLWIILGSLVLVLGLGTGTFAFLYYNSDNNKTPDQALVDSKYNSKTESGSPSPIGGISMPGDDIINSSELIDEFLSDSIAVDSIATEIDSFIPESNDLDKKDEKTVTDWLAASPQKSKTETKRADKPNEKIESKNKDLAKNTKTTQTTSGSTAAKTNSADNKTTTTTGSKENATNKEKIIPKQITMQAGSSLTQIAMEYYGDKTFWVYIYEYNKSIIKDYNNVPKGTVLRLPLPSTYGINAKSKSSVDKAKQKQAQLLNWDVYN